MGPVEEKKIAWTEGRIASALAKHHEGREWAFITQVRNSTGYQSTVRTADAIAISLWPSRGVYATGYEIKISRADWKKELSEPEKAEEISKYCRNWYVAAPVGIVPLAEIPPNWGLVQVTEEGKLKWSKHAHPMDNIEPSWLFVAAVLRNVGESMVPLADVNRKIQAALEGQSKNNWELKESRRQFQKLTESVAAFEKASGITIDGYSAYFSTEIGRAVDLLRRMKGEPLQELREVQRRAECIAKDLTEFFEVIAR